MNHRKWSGKMIWKWWDCDKLQTESVSKSATESVTTDKVAERLMISACGSERTKKWKENYLNDCLQPDCFLNFRIWAFQIFKVKSFITLDGLLFCEEDGRARDEVDAAQIAVLKRRKAHSSQTILLENPKTSGCHTAFERFWCRMRGRSKDREMNGHPWVSCREAFFVRSSDSEQSGEEKETHKKVRCEVSDGCAAIIRTSSWKDV